MSGSGPPTNFPTAPMVGPGGQVTPAWRQFLLALWTRTGAAPGISAGGNATALATETAARTAADLTEATARRNGETALRAQIDTQAAELARLASAANGVAVERIRAMAAEAAEAIARAAGDTAAHILGLSFAAMPTADPGGGRLWNNAGAVWVGPFVAPAWLEDGGGYWLLEDGSRVTYG